MKGNARALQSYFQQTTHVHISDQTVRNGLRGMTSHPLLGPVLQMTASSH